MMEIEMPRITMEETDSYRTGKFVVEPLDRGYGHTLGNALRRVLLSNLPGAAVIGIMIEGVDHEFSTVKGVKEDVTEIILNLKSLNLKANYTDKALVKELHIQKSNAGRRAQSGLVYLHARRGRQARYDAVRRQGQRLCRCGRA